MNINEIEQNMDSVIILLKALSNNKRLAIVCALKKGEKSVGELEKIVGLSQSALSQHLARLRRDEILQTRRDAQTIFYSIADASATLILECLCQIIEQKKTQNI